MYIYTLPGLLNGAEQRARNKIIQLKKEQPTEKNILEEEEEDEDEEKRRKKKNLLIETPRAISYIRRACVANIKSQRIGHIASLSNAVGLIWESGTFYIHSSNIGGARQTYEGNE